MPINKEEEESFFLQDLAVFQVCSVAFITVAAV